MTLWLIPIAFAWSLIEPRSLVDVVVLSGFPVGAFLYMRLRQMRKRAVRTNALARAEHRREPEEMMRSGDIMGAILVAA
ncbi:MAG: hypothetical protein KGL39_38150, partial [Patescibacteria group bacterium]|nr:hypothetical protein [Patescibacteria group bacterium]